LEADNGKSLRTDNGKSNVESIPSYPYQSLNFLVQILRENVNISCFIRNLQSLHLEVSQLPIFVSSPDMTTYSDIGMGLD